jgi:hypothetical protein
LLLVVIHFGMTALFAFPLNPLKMALEPILSATIGSFFPQTWSLFAPSPVADNYTLLAQCLDAARAAKLDAGESLDGEWQDVSEPLQRMRQANPVSAYDRVARPQWAAIQNTLTMPPDIQFLVDNCKLGDQDACKVVQYQLDQRREAASRSLARIGSAYCADVASPGATVRVALRARTHHGLAWSKRYSDERPAPSDVELGAFPFDPTVARAGIFATEVMP